MSEVMIKKIDKNISCLQKLTDNEMKFNRNMDDFMKKTHFINYETIECLVKKAEQQLSGLKNKVDNMNAILNRKDVVITIFGSVSVGKSYLMNVLLNDEIFRSSSGHSTSCFVTVKKGDDNCLMYRDKKVKYDNFSEMKDKINELSSSLCKTDNTLQNKDILQIIIKKPSSPILKNNVVIVDTPGADRNTNIHDIIKEQSQNSDIFIFMINGNITDVDRGFFDYQTETSVRPDIFILVNKWDQYDDEDESATENSKLSITEQCSSFIRKQNGGNEKNIESQIYFISTKEALDIRHNLQASHFTRKKEKRNAEFLKFEDKLQKYIDNPEKNKERRYNEELNVRIGGIISEFKDNFNRWKNSSNAIYSNNLKGDVENLKKELNTFIDDNISDVLNINDVTDINRRLSKLNEDCKQKVTKFFKKLDTSCDVDKENRNDLPRIGTESSASMVPIVLGNASRKKNIYQYDENNTIILNEMREELKIDVEFVGKKMYYQYERILNEICKKVEEGKKYWEDYICELNKIVSDLI